MFMSPVQHETGMAPKILEPFGNETEQWIGFPSTPILLVGGFPLPRVMAAGGVG